MENEQVVTIEAPFTNGSWSETPPTVIEEKKEIINDAGSGEGKPNAEEKIDEQKPAIEEEILDPKDWLKREFDVDDPAVLKSEREEYKKLKEQKDKGFEFADEQSKRIHELIRQGKRKEVKQFLETQEKLETLVSAEVNDDTAAEIIKMGMQLKYKDLTPAQIEHKFNKQFSLPKQPVESPNETTEEFEERVAQWERDVNEIKMDRLIEAQLIKPELEKSNTELSLPNIEKEENPNQSVQTQEELDKIDMIRKNFLSKLESDYKIFNGYEFRYKDEEVEIPVNYVVPDEQKTALKQELEDFDVDSFIGTRWFNQDGSPNVTQMMDDVTLLRDKEKIFQKVANEIGSKMKEHYIKVKSNVSVNGSQQSVLQSDGEKTEMDKQIDFIWKNG